MSVHCLVGTKAVETLTLLWVTDARSELVVIVALCLLRLHTSGRLQVLFHSVAI